MGNNEEVLLYLADTFGMKLSNKGVKYLAESIRQVAKNKRKAISFRTLYADIAKKYNTTYTAVERLMRYEVNKYVNDMCLSEFIFRQAIIINQKIKKRKRGKVNEFCKEAQQGKII